ncbi:MAG: efflux RND transporter permease subunit [Fimbriimonadia bacterium]|nr:efflux RND transporter permease subunit [Fimbriimonadia bacterium]
MNTNGFNIVQWSVRHPVAVIAFYVGLLAMAIYVIGFTMPRRMMPYVESPLIGIVTRAPGLSAEEMELYYSKPIEQRMTGVPGVRYIRSTAQEGYSLVSLEFPYGTDMQRMLTQVQALLTAVQDDLPMQGANTQPSWVLQIDPLNLPVLTLSVTGDSRWDPARLREVLENEIADRMKMASGDIYTVSVFGGYRRQMQVLVNREKLRAFGLSMGDVRRAIDSVNRAQPAGRLTAGDREEMVRLDTLARSVREVETYPVKAVNGRIVYIKDIAQVVDTYDEKRSGYHHQWQDERGSWHVEDALAVNVLQNPWASSPRVIEAVMAKVREFERDYPGIRFKVAYNNAEFVDILLHNLFEELLLAVLLTGLVIWLFLGNARMTLIALTAIPTSMAMAILALVPLNMSLNSSTLIGLLFAIGRLVDDAIIDLHAVERHLRMGKDRVQATVDGITEVRRAVAASTVMICIALAPLLFSGGIVELMFVGLVWPLIFGLLASFFVSLTLTAVLASRFLKVESGQPERRNPLERWILLPCQRFLDKLEGGYANLIRYLLKHRFVNMVRVLATLVVGFGFYFLIGSEMMPLADVGQAYLKLEMQPGTSYAGTEKAVQRIQKIVQKYPEILHSSWEIGAEGGPGYYEGAYFTGYGGMRVNGATAMLTLKDKDTRKRDIWQVIDAIQEEATATIPGIRLLQIKEMGSDVMATSAAPIQILVYGQDLHLTSRLAEETLQIAKEQVPDFYQPGTSWEMSLPSWQLEVDLQKAAQVSLTPEEIASQAYYSLKGGYTEQFYRFPTRRQTTILLRYDEAQRQYPQDLENLVLVNSEGKDVLMKSVARLVYRSAPTLIERDGLRRVVSVMGYYRKGDYQGNALVASDQPAIQHENNQQSDLPIPQITPRPSMDVAMDVMMKTMTQINWPPRDYGMEVRGDMTQMMDSFRRMLGGFVIALILMYLVLVVQFGSFLQPAQMLFSLPLELSGVFIFLYLMHQAFSTVSILGVIVLTGMDITAAILLIDHILHYRSRGVARNEAVVRGCTERLRPILMTSLVTVAALSPVAFFPQTGTDAYQPLGTAVVGGLLVGTILSLIDIPIMHTLVDDLQQGFRRFLGKGKENSPEEN